MTRVPAVLFTAALLLSTAAAQAPACSTTQQGKDWKIAVGGGVVTVRMDPAEFDMGAQPPLAWVCDAARAVSTYYGKFPVPQAQVQVHSRKKDGISGTTWAGHKGAAGPYTHMTVGQHTRAQQMDDDWTMTHELTHMAFPELPENQHWAEEGMAVYLEPIERVQAGELSAVQAWHDMRRDMQQGQPESGDSGLDKTHTWARTYWGGAIFWFAADVEIYKRTNGKKSLRDAMQGILKAGGSIEQNWTIERTLEEGDKATGTTVLMDEYHAQAQAPGKVDLDALWKEIGVNSNGSSDAGAPLAGFYKYVMQP
jgi:hypothetical protein